MAVDEILYIEALGGLRFTLDEQAVEGFAAQKAGALLVYLAYTGQPQARERLAELLWPDHSPERALGSLRMALNGLRRNLAPYLQTSRLMIGLVPGRYRLDAHEMVGAVESFRLSQGRAMPHLVRRLNEALKHYRGDFLRDFFGGSPEFEAWLYATREHLKAYFCEGTLSLTDYYMQAGQYAEALAALRRAWVVDPLNEAINRRMMLALSRSGRSSEALEHYQEYRRRLAAELEVEPSAETTALYQLLRSGRQPDESNGHKDARPQNLPIHPTPMIGRENLLADIAARLSEPDSSLLTLVGPGGIGKTRLALAAADMQRHGGMFPDGVVVVPLDAYSSAAQIAPAVAAALGYQALADGRSLRRQISDFIRQKKILLVLDNYEHLLDGADFAVELAACPFVHIVVTSREPLQVEGEKLLPITGLPYPTQDSPPPDYDAARLFLRAVQRLYPDYSPTGEDDRHIAQICRLVDGSPLGLLLAAAWMDVLTLEEIAAQIQWNIQLLENRVPGLPERHRSIRAVFAVTLDRLPASLRAIFMKLAVFRGGCTRQAAQAVTAAGVRDLQELAGKSLLMRDAGGRFTVHELLRQYAEAQLRETDLYHAARDAHSAYYLNFLVEREADIKGQRQQEALKEIDTDFENVRSAWLWASERGLFDILDRALEGLYWYCDLQGLPADRFALLQTTLEQAERTKAESLYGRLLARCWQTPAEGRVRLRRAFAIALRQERAEDIAQCMYQRGRAALLDNRDTAPGLFELAYHAYRSLGDSFYSGVVSSNWAVSLIYAGKAEQSETICSRELPTMRRNGNRIYLARLLYNQASSLATRGDNAAADQAHREARKILFELSKRLEAADIGAWGMGVTAVREGHFDLARGRAQELLALAEEYHAQVLKARALSMLSAVALVEGEARSGIDLALEATTLLGNHANATYADGFLAAAAAAAGNFAQSREICRRWLGLAVRVRERVLTALLLVPAAAVLAHLGQYERAAECLSLALHCPASMGCWAEKVFSLYGLPGHLKDNLPPERYGCAWERGKTLDPQIIAALF